MQKKYFHILFMLFSYAIALGHDAIPHHHFDNAIELEHHHHHDPLSTDHEDMDVLFMEGKHSEGHHHVFCHYSGGDSKSLAGADTDLKIFSKKLVAIPTVYIYKGSPAYIHKQPAESNCNSHNFADSSAHLLSSGLRAPPALS